MFTSTDLIQQVRDSLLEYDGNPITDAAILRKLNFAYNFAYNIIIKQQDSMFCRWKYIAIGAGINVYDLPKELYNKRITKLYTPVPVFDPATPIQWVEIQRCDAGQLPRFEMPRFNTYYVGRWTQMGNKIYLAPNPNCNTTFRFLVTPRLVKLGKVQGQITSIVGNKITIDQAPDTDFETALLQPAKNFMSISDEMTGEVKAVYPYNEINGFEITLAGMTSRTTLEAFPVHVCNKLIPAGAVTYDPLTKICTMNVNSNPTSFLKIGDIIEVQCPAIEQYNIIDLLETDADPYNPPEYTVASKFTTKGIVSGLTASSVSWQDDSVIPDFVDGYPVGFDDGTFFGDITTMVLSTLNSLPIISATCLVPHNLPIGRMFKLNILGTGTNCNGVKKCIVTSDTEFAILQASFLGVFVPGTWAMYQYPSTIIVTGWPAIYDVSPNSPKIDLLNVFSGSPECYRLQDGRTSNTPDIDDIIGAGIAGKYDHMNDINIGDYVTLGLTTGKPITDDLLADLLVSYAVITLKSSINETDAEVTAILKEKIMELKSDTDNRNLNIELQSDPFPSVAFPFRGRR